jgi:hypothetical protein
MSSSSIPSTQDCFHFFIHLHALVCGHIDLDLTSLGARGGAFGLRLTAYRAFLIQLRKRLRLDHMPTIPLTFIESQVSDT